MENRPLEPSPLSASRQVVLQPLPVQKPRFVFPLLRLEPLDQPEAPTGPLSAPHTPPCSTFPDIDIQYVQSSRLPDARAPNPPNQLPPVYLLHTRPTSTKVEKRARYAYIPAEHKVKEIGTTEALLGCAILILITLFVIIVLYYVATY